MAPVSFFCCTMIGKLVVRETVQQKMTTTGTAAAHMRGAQRRHWLLSHVRITCWGGTQRRRRRRRWIMLLLLVAGAWLLGNSTNQEIRHVVQHNNDNNKTAFSHGDMTSSQIANENDAFSNSHPQTPLQTTTFAMDTTTTTSSSVCGSYKGILRIARGDGEAAVGTMFFMYIVSHVLYAEQHNLLPWVFLDPFSGPCFDEAVHGTTNETTWRVRKEGIVTSVESPGTTMECRKWKRVQGYPGKIVHNNHHHNQTSTVLETFVGNGVWDTYFESLVRGFDYPHDVVCQDLPLIELAPLHVFPGLHYCAPWSVHAWSMRRYLPRALQRQDNQTLLDWFRPMRERGSRIVSTYYRPLPWLQERIDQANPNNNNNNCLAMHIRMTDKGHGRPKRQLQDFQPYAEIYLNETTTNTTLVLPTVYIATDDGTVLDRIRQEWWWVGKNNNDDDDDASLSRIRTQAGVHRSQGVEPVFKRFHNVSHTTNTEGLVDMYAMSRCQFLVHGFSAMAEAAHYLNYPQLHTHSVNLDDTDQPTSNPTLDEFRQMVIDYAKTL